MEDKKITQIVIGGVFSFFVLMTILMNSIIWILEFSKFDAIKLFILIVEFVISFFTIFDIKHARSLQVLLMLINSSICFIYNGDEDFFSWGFILFALILSYHYELLKTNLKMKIFGFILSFVISISLSAYLHKDPFIIPAAIIYLSCILFFICFVFRDIVKKIIHSEYRIADLEKILDIKEQELEKQRLAMSINPISYTTITELNKKLQLLETENLKQKEEIKCSLSNYILREEEIIKNKDLLTAELKNALPYLKNKDYQILSIFYLSQGCKTNREIAYELGLSEQSVKNSFHTIFNLMETKSRSEVILKLEKIISNIDQKEE